jgi:deoxyadenosine/deoxycytidine kinase
MQWRYIVIEGNIGAGKTSLATMLAERTGCRLVLEQFADNPFLPVFYENPAKYAFPLELSFVAERYQQLKSVLGQPDIFHPGVISDYYLLKSAIFARVNLPDLEYELFERLFRIVFDSLPRPDLILFLNSDIGRLQQNIRKRGRPYEQQIADSYLEQVRQGYADTIKSIRDIPVLLVESSGIDFVEHPAEFEKIVALLKKKHPDGLSYIKIDEHPPG